MKTVIIKYNAGNIRSVLIALERLGVEAIVSDDPTEISAADKVIFPGVGEAGSAMNYLRERNLDQLIKKLQQPVLGICLGMQLMCQHSEESNIDCLGIFPTNVRRFSVDLKVPQVGWNNIQDLSSPLLEGLSADDHCYFVHSYRADICENTVAVTDYGERFSSALWKDNFYGVQFHPEKSASAGDRILKNFLAL